MVVSRGAGKTLKECLKVDFEPFNSEYISASNFDNSIMLKEKSMLSTAKTINNILTPEDIEISVNIYAEWVTD